MSDVNIELTSNWYGTRAHWSQELTPYADPEQGRSGEALCSRRESFPVVVYDQPAMDYWMRTGSQKRKTIAEMPVCKKCERARQRLRLSRGGDDQL